MWSALADPDAFRRLLPPPPPMAAEAMVHAAWWTPLVHLARFGLGLPHPGAGLHQFLRSSAVDSEAQERARRLIRLWWGDRVDDFVAWGVVGGDDRILQYGQWRMELPRDERLPERVADDTERHRRAPEWQAVWAGGEDPLHLSSHSDHPLSPVEPAHLVTRGDRLVLRAEGYGGWYRALMQLSELAPVEGCEATVEIRGFGTLGTYRLRPGRLPRLHSMPDMPRSRPPRPDRRPAPPADTSRPSEPSTVPSTEEPALLHTVLRRAVAHLRTHHGSSFVLDMPSAHAGDGAYTQAMSLPDGRVYAEVPSDQFLTPALTPAQRAHLLSLGWSDPSPDTPNHWCEWASDITDAAIAEVLLATLTAVYGVTGGEFTLAPAALAAEVIPDSVPVTFSSGQGEPGEDEANYRSWLALVERASAPSATAVALSVARCPEVDAARSQAGHPCRPIVTAQPSAPHRFQVPEAWAGNIGDGRIVFISSNPSLSEAGDHQAGSVAEQYPTAAWSDEDIADFVLHRFDSRHGWATPEGRFQRQDGSLSPKPVAFWNNVRRRASELLEREASPAADYAMTEVVHCKSKGEFGVGSAAATCADRHLDSVLALSPAELLVVLGQRSRTLLTELWPLGADFGRQKGDAWRERDNLALVTVGGRQRLVAYLWHPTGATAPKTFAGAYPLHLERLRALVRGEIPPAAVLRQPPT